MATDVNFLAGTGEMATRMRAYDWTTTSLGPPEHWPSGLRTAMRLLLNSHHPMHIFWGAEATFFYNDGFVPSAGPERHPSALGRPASESWGEIWPVIGSEVAKVRNGGGHTWYEDQHVPILREGRVEDAYWTYGFSPIDDESAPNGIGGVISILTETTRRKALELDLRALNQSLEQQVETRTAERNQIWQVSRDMLLVSDSAGVWLSVNPAWTRVLGWTEAELVGRTSEWLEHPDDQAKTRAEISRLAEGATTLAFENRFRTRSRGYRTLAWTAVPNGNQFYCVARDVTDERARAVAQGDAERVQMALAAGAIIGTWVWDLPSDQFTIDEAFATAFGLDPVLGREGIPLAQIVATVHPDDQAGLAEAINEAIRRSGPYAHQYRVRRHDGRYHWLEANGHVEHGPDGTPLRFPGVLLDAVARRYDVAFGELSERLRALRTPQEMAVEAVRTVGVALGLSRVAYGEVDASGRHITLAQDWLAEGQRSIRGTHDFEDFGSYVEALRHGEDVVIDDVTTDVRSAAQVANFRAIDVAALVNLPLMEHGGLKVVFCLNDSRAHAWTVKEVAFARRVMERAEVEIARRAAEDGLHALNASLELQVAERTREYDRSWRLSNELLAAAYPDGTLEAVNPAWTAALGWEAHELVGNQFVAYTHPEDLAETMRVFATIFERPLATPYEYRIRHRDGSYRWIAWTAAFEDDRIYAAGRDTTVERDQAEALRQSQKMEAVGQLTGGVAHDFNNLLTIIRSSVDFLRRPDLPDERRSRYMDAVSDTVDRAAKLTGQLLAFARRQVLKPEVFDVGAKLRGVGDMLDTVTGSRIPVSIEIPDDPCYARADVSQFETALVNMAVNARDAMDGEGRLVLRLHADAPKPPIRLHAASEVDFVALSVTDTGTGIAPDQLGRIFEPFFTTKGVGKGTGLGLSQVFGFAKQSGGDINVSSVLGKGTTFTLYLPQEMVAPAVVMGMDVDAGGARGRGQHVLVVEDNVEVGQFCTQILEDLGYVTTWTATAEEALDRLGSDGGGFNAVFTDVVMPGMGGVALAETLRERLPAMPVVLTSGYSHVLALENDHSFELLQKPYSAEQLARILQRVMAGVSVCPSFKVAS